MNWALLQKTTIALLCAIMFGVAFQGVIAVVAEVNAPNYALLLKSWKEVLLGVVGILLLAEAWRSHKLKSLLRDRLLWLIAAIGVLHIALLLLFDNYYVSEFAGLLIDLRFYLLFAECYIAIRLWPEAKKSLQLAAAGGIGVVMVFALLQVTVLPKDILSSIGYSKATIQPYLTVDLNQDYVRINSTLRGPNPLGALAMMTLSIGAALWLRRYTFTKNWQRWLVWLVTIGAIAALWSSYSRSAWLAVMVAAVVLAVAVGVRRLSRYVVIGGATAVVLASVAVLMLQHTPVVQNLVFHTNPDSPTIKKSDDGHLSSLENGTEAMLAQPWGAGLGSTGSASLLTKEPKIIENQYLYMAHESGWLGLIVQLWLFGWVLLILWRHRLEPISLGLLASGVGLAAIGMVLPVWVDDTVAMLWWSLAAVAVASYYNRKETPHARTHHKKATRTT